MRIKVLAMLLSGLTVAACGQQSESSGTNVAAGQANNSASSYLVLGEDLQQLKDDFNANEGKVRLLFIVGPTCASCLRNLIDLNDEVLTQIDDANLQTSVVYVPTGGAKEKHIPAIASLIKGERISQYWENTGIIGQLVQQALETNAYMWDTWMIYGPDAIWADTAPPEPDFWMHMHGPLDLKKYPNLLDIGVFQSEVQRQLSFAANWRGSPQKAVTANTGTVASEDGHYAQRLPDYDVSSERQLSNGNYDTIPFLQPKSVFIPQHIIGRGTYRALKSVETVTYTGTSTIDGTNYKLIIETRRPNWIRRTLQSDQGSLQITSDNGQLKTIEAGAPINQPAEISKIYLKYYDFDGYLVEWKDKGNVIKRVGLHKSKDMFAWVLSVRRKTDDQWLIYGDIDRGVELKRRYISQDNPKTELNSLDYREVDGIQYPFRQEYLIGDRLMVVDLIDNVTVTRR